VAHFFTDGDHFSHRLNNLVRNVDDGPHPSPSLDKFIRSVIDSKEGGDSSQVSKSGDKLFLLRGVNWGHSDSDEFLDALDDLERAHFVGGAKLLLLRELLKLALPPSISRSSLCGFCRADPRAVSRSIAA